MKERADANEANRNSSRKAKRLVLMVIVHACRVTKLGGFNPRLQIIFFPCPLLRCFLFTTEQGEVRVAQTDQLNKPRQGQLNPTREVGIMKEPKNASRNGIPAL